MLQEHPPPPWPPDIVSLLPGLRILPTKQRRYPSALLWKEWQHHLGVREKKGGSGGEGKGKEGKIGPVGFLSKYC